MSTLSHLEIIGLDVSRDWLDLHCLSDSRQLRLPNTDAVHAELERMALDRTALVCFEATGGHEWRLWERLEAAGVDARQLPPAQIKAFGKSRGTLARTGRIDAELIARFMAFRPEAGRRLPSGKLRDLKAATKRRQLVDMRCIARPARRPERPASSKTSTPISGRCWSGASRTWSSGSRPASTPTEPCPKPPPSCGRFRGSGLRPARCRSRRCPSSAGSLESRPPRSRGSRRSRGKRTADVSCQYEPYLTEHWADKLLSRDPGQGRSQSDGLPISLRFAAEPLSLIAGLDDLAMVREPVEQDRRHLRQRWKCPGSLVRQLFIGMR